MKSAGPPKVVVVGGGIVGASIAFHLADRGVSVTVVDSGRPGESETSLASFGWINAREKNPKVYHFLSRKSVDMWPRFAERLDGDVGLRWGGDLSWWDTPEREKRLKRAISIQRRWGNPVRLLSLDEIQELEPELQPDEFSIGC